MDLELAAPRFDPRCRAWPEVGFQFYACLMFGLLCTSFLQHSRMVNIRDQQYSARRYMKIIAYTAVQGVYAFVFIGVLRTIFDITVTYISEMPKYEAQAQLIQDKVLSKALCSLKKAFFAAGGDDFQLRHLALHAQHVPHQLLGSGWKPRKRAGRVPDIAKGLNGANPKWLGQAFLEGDFG